jgi:flagellar basal-body rod modification protein FlgD
MQVNNNSGINQNYSSNGKSKNMAVEDFLQIMAAEIKNQNPLGGDSGGGGSKTDYLSQLAQFTMLEQMNILTEGINQINMLNQVSLIGKQVTIYNGKDNVVGTVEKVKFYNSTVILQVDGEDYPIGLLMEVSEEVVENEL